MDGHDDDVDTQLFYVYCKVKVIQWNQMLVEYVD